MKHNSWRIVASLLITVSTFTMDITAQINPNSELVGRRYYGFPNEIYFGETELEYKSVTESGLLQTDIFKYKIEMVDSIPFIRFEDDILSEWLVLYSERLIFIYDSTQNYPFFYGVINPRGFEALHIRSDAFETSSSLQEGIRLYSASNLGNIELNSPWVEGIPGQGIGETITIHLNGWDRFWVSSGYISLTQTNLFTKNSRPRNVRIVNESLDIDFSFELLDTPNPQLIELDTAADKIYLQIESVYPGTVWEDTAINFIVLY